MLLAMLLVMLLLFVCITGSQSVFYGSQEIWDKFTGFRGYVPAIDILKCTIFIMK
jgi:hypothetical protein